MNAAAIKVLVIDDEPPIRKLLRMGLGSQGYDILEASNGKIALERLAEDPALIILDLGLPDIQGHDLLRMIRARNDHVPIVVLSSRGDEAGKVQALDLGADDYLTKPFAVRELFARIRSVLRRARMLPPNFQAKESGQFLAFGDWKLDTSGRHLLSRDGTMVALSGAEYRLLRVFLDHPKRVLTRDQLLNLTQGRDAEAFDRSIDLLVSRLRQRLSDDPRGPQYIKTLRSEGYIFSSSVVADADGQA